MNATTPLWAGFLALLGLAGCTQQPGVGLAQLELALTASEKAALVYVTLPQCIVDSQPLCSERAIVTKIKTADAQAFAALMAAKAAPADNPRAQAAAAAVAALVASIPITPPAKPVD